MGHFVDRWLAENSGVNGEEEEEKEEYKSLESQERCLSFFPVEVVLATLLYVLGLHWS